MTTRIPQYGTTIVIPNTSTVVIHEGGTLEINERPGPLHQRKRKVDDFTMAKPPEELPVQKKGRELIAPPGWVRRSRSSFRPIAAALVGIAVVGLLFHQRRRLLGKLSQKQIGLIAGIAVGTPILIRQLAKMVEKRRILALLEKKNEGRKTTYLKDKEILISSDYLPGHDVVFVKQNKEIGSGEYKVAVMAKLYSVKDGVVRRLPDAVWQESRGEFAAEEMKRSQELCVTLSERQTYIAPPLATFVEKGETVSVAISIMTHYKDSLDNLLNQLDPTVVLYTLRNIAVGMEYLHLNGVVHRDLKESNVFVAHDGSAKVSDMDTISKIDEVDGIAGSPGFMAPELFGDAKAISGKSDVWSWGVIAYHLVTQDGLAGKIWKAQLKAAEYRSALAQKRSAPNAIEMRKRDRLDGKVIQLCEKIRVRIPRAFPSQDVLKKLISGALELDPTKRLSSTEVCDMLDPLVATK